MTTKIVGSVRPPRTGFYKVQVNTGEKYIAEYCKGPESETKQWYRHVGETPTSEKVLQSLKDVVDFTKAEPGEVAKALYREKTPEEQIELSYERYQKQLGVTMETPFALAIPECRKLTVGQNVCRANLREPKVAALHDEGQTVTLVYRDIKTKLGEEIDNGFAYMTLSWIDVLPVPLQYKEGIANDRSRWTQSYMTTRLEHLIHRVYREGLSDTPDYQRGYTWTAKDKELYLETLFEGRDLGRFLFVRENFPKADILFDGKQRLRTLVELVSSTIAYKGVYWHEMSRKDRHMAMDKSVQFGELDVNTYSRADLLQIFLDVNAAGVPQTQEHLEKVRQLLDAELQKTAA